jgi:hypothetical protein
MSGDDLPFKVVRTNGHDEVLGRAINLIIGRAANETAQRLYEGVRVMADVPQIDPMQSGTKRRSTRRCSMALRDGDQAADPKPPQAAGIKSLGG